jgi:hypothetical protein
VNNELTVTGGNTFTNAGVTAGFGINLFGNAIVDGTLNMFNGTTGTLRLHKPVLSGAQVLTGNGSVTADTLELLPAGGQTIRNNMDVNPITVIDNLAIPNNSLFTNEDLLGNPHGRGLQLAGNLTFGASGQVNMSFGSGLVRLNGTALQTLSGTGSSNIQLNNLEINNPAHATISMPTPVNLAGNLNLINGRINTTVSTHLVMAPAATVSGGSNTSFINGPMRRQINSSVLNTELLNPVGKAGAPTPYRPATLYPTSITGAHEFDLVYFPNAHPAAVQSNFGGLIRGRMVNEYWLIDKVSVGDVALRIKLPYATSTIASDWSPSLPGNGFPVFIVKAQDNVSPLDWEAAGEDIPGFNFNQVDPFRQVTPWTTATDALWTVPLTTFSPFAFGYGRPSVLPITLLSFEAVKDGKNALLTWKVESDKDLAYFEIEHSINGRDFSKLGTVQSSGSGYQFLHSYPGEGNHHYRLVMVEKDGRWKYSPIRLLNFSGMITEIQMPYPNPFTNTFTVKIISNLIQDAVYVLYDGKGTTVASGRWNLFTGTNQQTLRNLGVLGKGVFYLRITTDDGTVKTASLLKL